MPTLCLQLSSWYLYIPMQKSTELRIREEITQYEVPPIVPTYKITYVGIK